jgi:predicted transcriptional regulator
MSILKAPPKQPKNATLQVRLGEDLKGRLDKYAEFLDSTDSYVVSEALKLVFNKDTEFKVWLERQQANGAESTRELVAVAAMKEKRTSAITPPAPKANGSELLR